MQGNNNDKRKKETESAQEILKRIESQSANQKRQKTMNLFNREQIKAPKFVWWQSAYNNLKSIISFQKKELIRHSSMKQNKHIAAITIFFLGALWVSWKIQQKYDKLRRRAKNTKSLKQKQIESQNEYIKKMLAKNPFTPVPIEEEEAENQDYIFKKAEFEFDTRADLMEVLEEQRQMLYRDKDQQ